MAGVRFWKNGHAEVEHNRMYVRTMYCGEVVNKSTGSRHGQDLQLVLHVC